MVTAFFFSNFMEILATIFVSWLAYGFGRFVEKRAPHLHLRPWKWRVKRQS